MQGTHRVRHSDILTHSLARLGADAGRLLGYDVLADGASGAYAYRLHFPSGDQFLKVALPESSRSLLERARREILFYQRLAPELPIQVPKLVASSWDHGAGACLLLDAYDLPPKPHEWSRGMFVRVVEEVARLHAWFWDKERELSAFGWLRRVERPDEKEIRNAYHYWERLRTGGTFEAVLTPRRYRAVLGLLRVFDTVWAVPWSLPVTLCHGDFHIDNVLVDRGGEFVLADWQEVGVGRGPEDVSFFLQRASFSVGDVPAEEILEAYRWTLAASTGWNIPAGDVRRVVEVAELRTRLLHWPAFLANESDDQLAFLLERIDVLAASLGVPYTRG